MKKYMLLLFLALAGVLVLSSCGDDDDLEGNQEFLRYDGNNFTAPLLQGGNYTLAARFPASVMRIYDGQALTGIETYVADIPVEASVVVFRGNGTSTQPEQTLAEYTINPLDLASGTFNRIDFDTPIDIDGSEIWIGVYFVNSSSQQTIGCDNGPKDPNGDLMNVGGTWTNFEDFSGGESINWNIRGIVQ